MNKGMQTTRSMYLLLCMMLFSSSSLFSQVGWDKMEEIERHIIPPLFPDKNYGIINFGAKEGGESDCRPAINAAISKCSEDGGGKVIVPPGKYYVGGSILLKSNVNLHFEEGCEVLFSSRSEDYLPMVLTRWEGTELYNYSPLIYAYNAVNIAITGKGKLDGNGVANIANWKPKQKKAQQALREMGRKGVPVYQRLFGENHYLRPAFIELFSCSNILIEGISLTNSPFWLIHPVYCDNVTVRKVFIDSHTLNSDGCDPESSSNVLIEDCHFITEDDGVAIKAGRDNDAWRVGRPSENIIIRNSVFESSTNGVCIGSEMSAGVRNVFVENVKVPKATHAVYFKSNLDRGGFIENIRVRGVAADSVSYVIKFEPDYKSESKENHPTRFHDFVFENISCNYAKEFGIDISGYEKKPVQNVSIHHMTVKKAGRSVRIRHAEKVQFNHVVINGQPVEPGELNQQGSPNGGRDAVDGNSISPIAYTRAVADRIMADASFELVRVGQKNPAFPCIVDATPFTASSGQVLASGNIQAKKAGKYRFGFTSDAPCVIYLNGEEIVETKRGNSPFPKEIAYGIYEFPSYRDIKLTSGDNPFSVSGNGKVSFGVLDENGFSVDGIHYMVEGYMGVNQTLYEPPVYTEMKIAIPKHAVFQKHPYTEWHYANGTTMFGILALGTQTGDARYTEFVERFCRFTLENEPLFREQYYHQNALRTQNFRIFRCAMLDDSSAPALPFIALYLHGFEPEGMLPLLARMEHFVMNEQPRLEDGTFVRPEPKWTIWADDLFMSSPFLLRYGRLTGEQRYYDEVASQIIHYDRYLYDEEAKLYHHGWNVTRNEPQGQFWGRANGWLVWAVSEALLYLPESHPQYKTIRGIHQRQLENLAAYQDVNGMWHQVLNMPESYEETSCTAIFTMAMARAVRMGWIDRSFRKNALRGWNAMEKMIDLKTGVVSGICESMPIGPDLNFYLNRKTKANDPRGVGAVIASGVEIARLMNE